MSASSTTKDLNREVIDAFRKTEFTIAHPSREEAISQFERMGLPTSKQEEYRYTPITRALEPIFLSNSLSPAEPTISSVAPYLLPGYECNTIVFVNGEFNPGLSRIISPSDQLSVQSIADARDQDAASVETYFTKLVDYKTDAFAAYNTAFWKDAVVIHVPPNVKVDKPILILHLHHTGIQPVISASRLLMILGDNSEANLIEKFDSIGQAPVFSSWVEEIVVGEKARLQYCKVQNDPASLQVASTLIHQQNGSRVNTFTITVNGKIVRNNLRVAIDGERCESHFFGLYLLDDDTLVDNHTTVDHRKPNSFTNELYKGILDGRSRGVFNGKIYVRPQAQKTNAFQSNRNILLKDTAIVHTKPQLEIWADDVKCSHGCTSGQLDEEALFYLQSRGIDKMSAQALLLNAFAADVLETMKDMPLRNYLEGIIADRLTNPY